MNSNCFSSNPMCCSYCGFHCKTGISGPNRTEYKNKVYNSIQDEQGYIWFATDRGIAKYDGYSFKTLTTQEGLTDNTVFEFFKDSKQQLWCKTFSSTINRISNDSAYPYKYNNLIQTLFPTEILKELFFDKLLHQ